MGYRDDEREKPSWSQIDKMRNKSPHRKEKRDPEGAKQPFQSEAERKRNLKEAAHLFSGKLPKEQAQSLQAIHASYGGAGFKTAVKEYMEGYGMPQDWRTLLLLLDLSDADVLENAVEELVSQYKGKGFPEQRALVSKLRILAMSSKDFDITCIAKDALEELQG